MAEISLAMSNHKVSLDFLFHYHRYGATCHPDALPHMRKWMPMSRQELLTYFGIHVIMGMLDLPSYRN